MKLLLIEDDPTMRQTLERSLKRQGWLVQSCADGLEGLAQWQRLSFDAVLLDLSLPGLDGLEVLAQARQMGLATPVLIITARGTVGDRILGLNTGADDYLPKPFDLDELQARLRALVRARQRSADTDFEAKNAHVRGEISTVSYQIESGAFLLRGQPMDLSPRESALLSALFDKLGQAVAKERLFEHIFSGENGAQPDAMDVLAYRLRKKLTGSGLKLTTLRGLGYLLQQE